MQKTGMAKRERSTKVAADAYNEPNRHPPPGAHDFSLEDWPHIRRPGRSDHSLQQAASADDSQRRVTADARGKAVTPYTERLTWLPQFLVLLAIASDLARQQLATRSPGNSQLL